MSLTSAQEVELQSREGYKVHFLNYLDDYLTKALFMPDALLQIYQIQIEETDKPACEYALDNRIEIADQAGRALAVSTDVLDLGKQYDDANELLADLKTDVLKPHVFRLFKQWLPVLHQVALRRNEEIEQAITE